MVDYNVEVVVAYLKILSLNLPGGTEGNNKNLIQIFGFHIFLILALDECKRSASGLPFYRRCPVRPTHLVDGTLLGVKSRSLATHFVAL
jgi:hypothetical protein